VSLAQPEKNSDQAPLEVCGNEEVTVHEVILERETRESSAKKREILIFAFFRVFFAPFALKIPRSSATGKPAEEKKLRSSAAGKPIAVAVNVYRRTSKPTLNPYIIMLCLLLAVP
jgi:hypothetical protein